jgi:CheY-like chemotaxis protein
MGKKILLVDDDSICHFIHTRMFERLCADCDIFTAQSGADALQRLSRDTINPLTPDLILLDLNMPVMDGFEFMKEFNAMNFSNKSAINVVMLTSSIRAEDSQVAAGFGVQKFLSKPLSHGDASAIISELCGKE